MPKTSNKIPPTIRQFTGAELIVTMLELYGITTVAGIPGGAILPLYDALSRSSQIKHILTRHEQGAGFIAQGIARTEGKPAVCIASSGPGATNLITAIADAKLDSIPLVCITGQVASSLIGTDAFQEVDTYGISIPVTKHNYLARSITELPLIIKNAFNIAMTGRPGPVWVDVPKDILTATIELDSLPELDSDQQHSPTITKYAIQQVADMIKQAKKPIAYLGGGIISSESNQLVKQLIDTAQLPTTTTLMGLGAIPTDHPLNLGMLGMHAHKSTNFILNDADLLLVLGARFDDRAVGKVESFCPDAKIIHVDIDGAELGKIKQPQVAIQADLHEFLTKLLPHIHTQQRPEWLDRIEVIKQQYPCINNNTELFNQFGFIRAIANIAGDNTIITTDVGKHQMWVAQTYPLQTPRQLLTSGGLGTMGFGLPAAIGAALAKPDKTIICFTGDGSIMMNLQEMATAVEHNLNIKIIVFDNQALGLVHQLQTLFFEKNIFSTQFGYGVDFIKIANGFGMPAYDIRQEDDPLTTLNKALTQKGPCLIRLMVDVEECAFPVVPPGASNIEMIGE
ncbi:acetolactate synthase large subunit [Orbaceae bacterium ac157xtp]